MEPLSLFLLLLQIQAAHVSSFATQQHHAHVGFVETLLERGRSGALTLPNRQSQRRKRRYVSVHVANSDGGEEEQTRKLPSYDLGVGKNLPVGSSAMKNGGSDESNAKPKSKEETKHWNVPDCPNSNDKQHESLKKSITKRYSAEVNIDDNLQPRTVRRMVARTEESSVLRGAIWHEEHYSANDNTRGDETDASSSMPSSPSAENSTVSGDYGNGLSLPTNGEEQDGPITRPELFYPNIDLSIPPSIYDPETSKDVVWDLMRWEAYQEAQREPLLVSFLYSSILNHDSLESSLAFLLANKLSSAAMISTQVQSLILDALYKDRSIGRAIRADIMAVRDRDPACTCLPDVFLYFKGFHALQTYRVAHAIWKKDNKQVLAHYLQSQMSQTFQIDIHPNATLGSGIMLDHGTGIVIGETSHLGHNCSILHHVTLGGSGKKGVDRHPKVGDGVLLGAGSSVLGNIKIGEGCQVGAGGLVITDLPPHSVAVGVPVKIIGSFVDVTEQPSIEMNQMMNQTFLSDGI
mmetsp:Transcript_21892/g.46194  ORF Transcript_21892/g.46194 Transcript_21892/m.46194 type:complete len:520 (-) Transcript_21892:163-1722(-)